MTSSGENSSASGSAEIERYCATCDQSYPDDWTHCPEDGTKLVRLVARKDPLLGKVIDGRFTIRQRIGAGGMGAVYEGWQASIGRSIAIKVIDTRLSNDRVAAKRFLREAKLLSQLSQPNTVTVIDFGQTSEGMLYLAMELIKGRTLGEVLKDEGTLPLRRVARIGYQICDALDAAHGMAIIHRDLKPANVMVLDHPPGRDLIKVLDFGLAKSLVGEGDHAHSTVTRSDVILGTPSYISPELIAGGATDARADLYSVGVLLYEMISGRLPFRAETVNALLAKHAYEEPDPLDDTVPEPIRDVILRLLSKAPEKRYQTAAETRVALQQAMEGVPLDRAITATSGPVPSYTSSARSLGSAAMEATVDAHARSKAGPASSPDTSVHSVLPRKRRTGLWIALVLVAASAAAGVGMALVRSGNSSSSDTAGEGAELAASDAPPDAATTAGLTRSTSIDAQPAPDAAVEMVELTITSRPKGAEITLGGESHGATPKTIRVPKSAAATELVLSHARYHSMRVDITPSKAQKLDYKLKPRRAGRPTDTTTNPPPPPEEKKRPPLVIPD